MGIVLSACQISRLPESSSVINTLVCLCMIMRAPLAIIHTFVITYPGFPQTRQSSIPAYAMVYYGTNALVIVPSVSSLRDLTTCKLVRVSGADMKNVYIFISFEHYTCHI